MKHARAPSGTPLSYRGIRGQPPPGGGRALPRSRGLPGGAGAEGAWGAGGGGRGGRGAGPLALPGSRETAHHVRGSAPHCESASRAAGAPLAIPRQLFGSTGGSVRCGVTVPDPQPCDPLPSRADGAPPCRRRPQARARGHPAVLVPPPPPRPFPRPPRGAGPRVRPGGGRAKRPPRRAEDHGGGRHLAPADRPVPRGRHDRVRRRRVGAPHGGARRGAPRPRSRRGPGRPERGRPRHVPLGQRDGPPGLRAPRDGRPPRRRRRLRARVRGGGAPQRRADPGPRRDAPVHGPRARRRAPGPARPPGPGRGEPGPRRGPRPAPGSDRRVARVVPRRAVRAPSVGRGGGGGGTRTRAGADPRDERRGGGARGTGCRRPGRDRPRGRPGTPQTAPPPGPR